MKHILGIIVLLLATSAFAQEQKQEPKATPPTYEHTAATAELNEAARSYKSGNFAEAQHHAERALQIEPSNKIAPAFIARSLHAQYRPGVESPENVALVRQAITAYERIVVMQPDNDEAFKAVAALYGAIGEEELQYSWILNRAVNGAVAAAKRAEAYVILASKDWNCSYTITEVPDNKRVKTTSKGDNVIIHIPPNDKSEFEEAQRCVTRGLEMAEMAILLESEDDAAWSFKTNLLIEAAKLAEMEGNTIRTAEFNQQANEAQARTTELTRQKLKELSDAEPENPDAVDPADGVVKSGTVEEGKPVSKPLPASPVDTKGARIGGTVVVEVLVDEKGNVIEAKAVSGDKRLRAAAEKAALQARFTPTLLRGRPVKVTGVIKYNFALN